MHAAHIAASVLLALLIVGSGLLVCYLSSCRRRSVFLVTPEALLIALVTGLAITSGLGLLLLVLSRFALPALLAAHGALVLSLLAALLRTGPQPVRLRVRPEGPRGWALTLSVAALLVLAACLRIPPSFYTDGGQDEGVYVNIAASYVRTGRILIHDEWLQKAHRGTALERAALGPLLSQGMRPGESPIPGRYEGNRLPGLYVADFERGTVVPQFYPLHSLWLAILWFLLGPQGSVYALTFFALLTLLVVYHLCREFFGDVWVGLASVALLAVNLLQVWVNRYPVSETLAQFWLFAGLWLYLRSRRTGSAGEMWLSVACFGGYAFTRLPALALLPAYAVAFLLSEGRRRDYAFFAGLLGVQVVAICYGSVFSFPYLRDILLFTVGRDLMPTLSRVLVAALGFLAIVVVAKAALQSPLWGPLGEWMLRRRAVVAPGLVLLLPLGFAARLVPLSPEAARAVVLWQDPTVRLTQVSWYLTWPGLVLAVAGLWLLLRRQLVRREHLFIAAILMMSLLFQFVVQFRNSYQLYYARYYMSEALPFLVISLCYLIVWLLSRRRLPVRVAGGIVAACLAGAYALPFVANPVTRSTELDGAYRTLTEIARYLPENSVTFVGAGGSAEGEAYYGRVGTGLMMTMGRYSLPADDLGKALAGGGALLREGVPTYLLWASSSAEGLGYYRPPGMALAPIARGVRVPFESERVLRVPRAMLSCRCYWTLYELRPEGPRSSTGTAPSPRPVLLR